MKAVSLFSKEYYKDPKNTATVDVALFIVLILSFHFLFLGWQNVGYWPLGKAIDALSVWASGLLYHQACWILEHVLRIDITKISSVQKIMTLDHNGNWANVTIIAECCSLKQWCHWLFLMLIFPGPWKHKLWYIPLGLVVIEWINVVRVVGLLIVQIPWPGSFEIAHNYVFKTFFYLVIFLMWVIWVEYFVHPKKKQVKDNCSITK